MTDDGFGHWLAGFADGEGCFYVNATGPLTLAQTRALRPMFRITLRDDDRHVLLDAARITGCGTVRVGAEVQASDHLRATWTVGDKAGTLQLCQLFDRHPLRAKKARDYAIWREAVYEWNGLNRRERLEAFRVALASIKRYEAQPRPLTTPAHEQIALEVCV